MIEKLDFVDLKMKSVGDDPMAELIYLLSEHFTKTLKDLDKLTLEQALTEVLVNKETDTLVYTFVLRHSHKEIEELSESIKATNKALEDLVNARG